MIFVESDVALPGIGCIVMWMIVLAGIYLLGITIEVGKRSLRKFITFTAARQ
jgi:hypothetical protein